mmetsp:Transcript_45535/g.54764  ORF Transcript_45535/g.54764 Transcript_45535/m.54764 type:complete len:230 (+) Transcript_45535:1871-2560(+)
MPFHSSALSKYETLMITSSLDSSPEQGTTEIIVSFWFICDFGILFVVCCFNAFISSACKDSSSSFVSETWTNVTDSIVPSLFNICTESQTDCILSELPTCSGRFDVPNTIPLFCPFSVINNTSAPITEDKKFPTSFPEPIWKGKDAVSFSCSGVWSKFRVMGTQALTFNVLMIKFLISLSTFMTPFFPSAKIVLRETNAKSFLYKVTFSNLKSFLDDMPTVICYYYKNE